MKRFQVCVTDEQYRLWRVAAAKNGMSMSEWSRNVLDTASVVSQGCVTSATAGVYVGEMVEVEQAVATDIPKIKTVEKEVKTKVMNEVGRALCVRCERAHRVGLPLPKKCEECGR